MCVYDNASGDETAQIVADISKADDRVTYFCHSENIGMFENHKFGLDRVDTEYYSFLPDDDVLFPDFFQTVISGFIQHPDALISIADVVHLSPGGNIIRTSLESWLPGFYPPPTGLIAIAEHGHIEFSGVLFKYETTDLVGPWDIEVGTANDLDFSMRIAAHYPLIVSKKPGAIFNQYNRTPHSFSESRVGFSKVISNITTADSISNKSKNLIENRLRAKLDSGLFLLGISYVTWGSYSSVRQIAEQLRIQKRPMQSIILTSMIRIHKHIPFVRHLIRFLTLLRRKGREKRLQNNQNQYAEIRKHSSYINFFKTL